MGAAGRPQAQPPAQPRTLTVVLDAESVSRIRQQANPKTMLRKIANPATVKSCYISPFGRAGQRIAVQEPFWRWGRHIVGKFHPRSGMIFAAEHPDMPKPLHGEDGYYWSLRPEREMIVQECRLFIEVVATRIERLQDISVDDCNKEGWQWLLAFRQHWMRCNGPLSWDTNPLVHVLEFRVTK